MRKEKYIKTTKPNTYIKVEVFYSLGGINYFNYKIEPRGYYLSAKEVERTDRGGYVSESYAVFGNGLKILLKEVKRQSKKAEADAMVLAEEYMNNIVDRVLEQNGLSLA